MNTYTSCITKINSTKSHYPNSTSFPQKGFHEANIGRAQFLVKQDYARNDITSGGTGNLRM